jgi:hypothetical protein
MPPQTYKWTPMLPDRNLKSMVKTTGNDYVIAVAILSLINKDIGKYDVFALAFLYTNETSYTNPIRKKNYRRKTPVDILTCKVRV